MGLSFLSDRGIEDYRYAWGDHGRIDGSKPLGLLQHVGGNPILGVVSRAKVTVERLRPGGQMGQDGLRLLRGVRPAEHAGRRTRKRPRSSSPAALPLVARLDKANRDMLIPALADGQSALVIDGKLQSKHFIESLPATEKPMPMAEPAIVIGVSDAKLLKQGVGRISGGRQRPDRRRRQIEGGNVPENIQIPEPQVTEGPLGTIYSFPLPKEWGVDEKIVPNLGVSDRVAVFSASRDHTERLLKATPLAAGGVLGQGRPPAGHRRLARLGRAGRDGHALGRFRRRAGRGLQGHRRRPAESRSPTRSTPGWKCSRCCGPISSESYLEDGVLVNHTLAEIRDVEK